MFLFLRGPTSVIREEVTEPGALHRQLIREWGMGAAVAQLHYTVRDPARGIVLPTGDRSYHLDSYTQDNAAKVMPRGPSHGIT